MAKRPSNFDNMRHVGGKSPNGRRATKRQREIMGQLQMEVAAHPVARAGFADWVGAVHDASAISRELRRAAALREIERIEQEQPPTRPLIVGDEVTSAAGIDIGRGPWTVMSCGCDLCESGRFVAVNQSYGEGWRHIAGAGLRRLGGLDARSAGKWSDWISEKAGVAMRQVESGHGGGAAVLTAWLAEMAAADAGLAT